MENKASGRMTSLRRGWYSRSEMLSPKWFPWHQNVSLKGAGHGLISLTACMENSISPYTHLAQSVLLWCGTHINSFLSILKGIFPPLGQMVLPGKKQTYTRCILPVLKDKTEKGKEF